MIDVRKSPEVKLTAPDLLEIVDRVAMSIQGGQPVELIFSAEGSAYPVLWVPLTCVSQAVPDGYGVGARTGSGGDPSMVYTARDAWHRQAGRWLPPGFHELRMVTERYVENPVDALPFCALLNLVEIARGYAIFGGTPNEGPAQRSRLLEILRQGYEALGSPRFDDSLPESFDR